MKRIIIYVPITLVVLLIFIACDNQDGADELVRFTEPAENMIWAEKSEFTPAEITVTAGMSVTWYNSGNSPVQIIAGESRPETMLFDSGVLLQGDKFDFVFDTPGRYSYHDSEMPSKYGIVIVE